MLMGLGGVIGYGNLMMAALNLYLKKNQFGFGLYMPLFDNNLV